MTVHSSAVLSSEEEEESEDAETDILPVKARMMVDEPLIWRVRTSHAHPAIVQSGSQPTRDNGTMNPSDEVDRIVGAWRTQRPDLDFSPLEVLSRVDRLSRHLDRARREVFRRSDIEPWEWDVLSALRRAGAPFQLSPKQLLQQTLVSSGTMTNRIDRLVGRRFVRRESDPDDGRSILVTLTEDGLIRVDAAITRLVDVEADLLRALPRAERERLAVLLRKLSLGFDG